MSRRRLELHIHHEAQAAAKLHGFVEKGNASGLLFRPLGINDRKSPQLLGRHLADSPLTLNNAAEVLIMAKHKRAVGRRLHIELDSRTPQPLSLDKGFKRIFGCVKSSATMYDDSGIRP